MVLASGARLRMVGIDQTSRVRLTRDDAAVLSRGDSFGRWAAECAPAWIDFLARAVKPGTAAQLSPYVGRHGPAGQSAWERIDDVTPRRIG